MKTFITPKIIVALFNIAATLYILAAVVVMIVSLKTYYDDPLSRPYILVTFAVAPIVAIFCIVIARVGAEFILVAFRIEEHLRDIRSRGQLAPVQQAPSNVRPLAQMRIEPRL